MKCYRKNGSDPGVPVLEGGGAPSMKCYRKNGSDVRPRSVVRRDDQPSMKCYRKNGSDVLVAVPEQVVVVALNEVLPKER